VAPAATNPSAAARLGAAAPPKDIDLQWNPRRKDIEKLESRVIAGKGGSPEAVAYARQTLRAMLHQADPDVVHRMAEKNVTVYVIPKDGKLTDLPAFASLKGQKTMDGRPWEEVRGVANVRIKNGVAAAVGEENLVGTGGYQNQGYVFVHELGHMVQDHGLPGKGQARHPPWWQRVASAGGALLKGEEGKAWWDVGARWGAAIKAYGKKTVKGPSYDESVRLYEQATKSGASGLGPYADTNQSEYFAQATSAYFGVGYNGEKFRQLESIDPATAAFLYKVYGPPGDFGK
jgi:hypothetical protein